MRILITATGTACTKLLRPGGWNGDTNVPICGALGSNLGRKCPIAASPSTKSAKKNVSTLAIRPKVARYGSAEHNRDKSQRQEDRGGRRQALYSHKKPLVRPRIAHTKGGDNTVTQRDKNTNTHTYIYIYYPWLIVNRMAVLFCH